MDTYDIFFSFLFCTCVSLSSIHHYYSYNMPCRGSPLSLKLTFKQLSIGRTMSLSDCFKMDHRLIHRLTKDTDSDFYRGVRARLIDKSNMPIWREPCLSGISSETIDWYFSPLPPHQELQLPNINSSLSSCKL